MRNLVLALFLVAACGDAGPDPVDVRPDVHHVDAPVQLPWIDDEVPPEYSAGPPRMAVPPPWLPPPKHPWDDLIQPPPPEPPPCLRCEEDGLEDLP